MASPRVMVFGTFDLFHAGHEFVLHEALKRGQVTVVVARAANVERIKGRSPRESNEVRTETIRRKFPTVAVVLGDAQDFLVPVRATKPDLILLGYDQRLPPNVKEVDLKPAKLERLPGYHPERFKSSLL